MFECADHADQLLLSAANLRLLMKIFTITATVFYHKADKICEIRGNLTPAVS